MPSQRFTLNQKDLEKWGKNAVIFLAPAVLVFLLQIQAGKSPQEAFIAVKLWALNTLIDLIKKFLQGPVL